MKWPPFALLVVATVVLLEARARAWTAGLEWLSKFLFICIVFFATGFVPKLRRA